MLTLVLAMAALSFAVVVAPARANHDTVHWNYSNPVTTDANAQTSWPWVLDDQVGHFYVSYNYYNTGTLTTNVNLTKYMDSQLGQAPVKVFQSRVNTVANVASSWGTAMALDPLGNLYVAWTRTDPTYGLKIFISKSTTGGASFAAEVPATAPNTYGSDYWPKIASTADGTIYVGWIQSWSGSSITVSKSTDHGATFGSWTNVSTQSASFTPSRFAMTADAHGRVYLVVEGYSTTLGRQAVYLYHSDDGVTWTAPTLLSSASVTSLGPSAAIDSAGRVYVTFLGLFGSSFRVYVTTSDDRGLTWSTPFPLTQGTSSVTYIPTIAVKHDTAMVVWGGSEGSTAGVGFVVSPDRGATWYPEEFYAPVGVSPGYSVVNADANGTFYAAYETGASMVRVSAWHSPPSTPVITEVSSSLANANVSWSANPEPDVVAYELFRSADGSSYSFVANVAAGQTSYTDVGLANGTYWYRLIAVDNLGVFSHPSAPASGTVGPTTQALINQLSAEIAALKAQLNTANTNLAAAQSQLTAIQNQLAAIKGNTTALQNQINNLQNQLNNLQAQQATQTISYANLAFEVIVVVLLVVLLLNQMRRPKAPQMMMAQPGQAEPKKPEDEL
ncbi:MAG TPA: exo-alpha-sialidase [Thermoplasmata archaeon]|nr:exo-alpha-sialidase [Thermoplasmata archaeon]